jgi:apolipoprotein N-acyltransferase
MVRAANSGITYFVDQYGRLRQELPISQPGVLVGNIGLLDEYSIFTRWGDIAGWLSFLLSLGLIAILLLLWLIRKIRSR